MLKVLDKSKLWLGILSLPLVTFSLWAQFIAPEDKKKSNANALIEIKTDKQEQKGEEDKKESPIENTQKQQINPKALYVQNITAEIHDKFQFDVKIHWIAPADDGDYIVARSKQPIDKYEVLIKADAIAVKPAGVNFHIDKSLPVGNYYYCVVSRRQASENKVEFVAEQNYTAKPVIVTASEIKKSDDKKADDNKTDDHQADKKNATDDTNKDKKEEKQTVPVINQQGQQQQIVAKELPVRLIFSQLIDENSGVVRLSWRGSPKTARSYLVYRSNTTIHSVEELQGADKIAEITNGAEFYVDKSLPANGLYYYAVTSRDREGNELMSLEADQSYTRNAIVYKTSSKVSPFSEEKNQEKNFHNEKRQSDHTQKGEQPNLENQSTGFRTEKKQDSKHGEVLAETTDDIIKDYYMKGFYKEALNQLSNIALQDRDQISKIKALFYSGLSCYYLERYRQAYDFFRNPLVVKGYGDRAKFWQKKALEQIK